VRSLGLLLLIGIGTYLLVAVLTYLLQPRYVFFPSRQIAATPAQLGIEYETTSIRTSDGLSLDGWYVPTEQRHRGVLLFLHGNAGNISHRLDSLMIFRDLGLSTLIIDYRGYGRSEGRPSEAGTYLDADAAWSYLVNERGVSPDSIVVFGRSLGGAVATWLAERYAPRALIVESTFTSVPDLGAELYPYLPVRLLARIRFDALSRISRANCPVLVVHSRDDEIVPFSHGVRLYEAASPPKDFVELHGGHNDAMLTSGRQYIEALDAFLSEHLGSGG
jgi:fermentation-respiration switch protein FrsA (DUF1100 family)